MREAGRQNKDGRNYADMLAKLYMSRAKELGRPNAEDQPIDGPLGNGKEAIPTNGKIDKSALHLSEPKRIRNKEHLKFVASQPCLVCDRRPAHAHHIKFAQAKALGRKVSDEFTVPLCEIHHQHLHQTGDERDWWKVHKVDPLAVASKLWAITRGNMIEIEI